ncbi:MAG: hypothetical protein IPO21_06715 [Bacteroidales bacterium]|nr:hypothetical protein [Bacteroidales bacterium]
MGLALTNNTIDKYFGFLSRIDNDSKKKMIIKLTESIETKEEPRFNLGSLFGAWEDNKDSDEIIKEIKNARVNNKNITGF